MTMEQMIDHCARFTDEINKSSGQNLTVEQMKEQMRQFSLILNAGNSAGRLIL